MSIVGGPSYTLQFSVFPIVSHVFVNFLNEMSVYTKPRNFGTVKNIASAFHHTKNQMDA